MSTADDQIRAKIEAFASELAVLVRQAAREAVTSVLEGAPWAGPVFVSDRKAPTALLALGADTPESRAGSSASIADARV